VIFNLGYVVKAVLATLLLCCSASLSAQVADTSGLETYTRAVSQARVRDRLAALERFVTRATGSSLRLDALHFLAWDAERTGDYEVAAKSSRELLTVDSGNSLALFVQLNALYRATYSANERRKNEKLSPAFSIAEIALRNLPRLRKPEGMNEAEFALLRIHVQGIIVGVVGQGLLEQHDYPGAREYLESAVTLLPNDPRFLYSLALVDMEAKNPDLSKAYWYLARAVVLTEGTIAGAQIAEFARKRYQQDGGGAAAWDKFLTAAARADHGNESPQYASSMTGPSAQSGVNSAPAIKGTEPRDQTRNTAKRASSIPAPPPITPEDSDVPTPEPPVIIPSGAPFSLGIVIEAALPEDHRATLANALGDMLRQLGTNDEAFILSFSARLEFEEDLTDDHEALRKALEQLQPGKGTALFDAVAFSSGHLSRIAKNPSRILLVVSDGRNSNSRTSPFELSGQITLSGVRVFCIGVGIEDDTARRRLQALASRTGGQAFFIHDLGDFRLATQRFARAVGRELPL
jgi:tetratricopeptide (TPR) repeat protein